MVLTYELKPPENIIEESKNFLNLKNESAICISGIGRSIDYSFDNLKIILLIVGMIEMYFMFLVRVNILIKL